MPGFIAAIFQFLSKESVERIMFTILIWAIAIWFAPVNYSTDFNQHAGFPLAFQIVVFALSYVFGLFLTYVKWFCVWFYEYQKSKFNENQSLAVLRSLSPGEMALLENFLRFNQTYFFNRRDDPDAFKLMMKKIITPAGTALADDVVSFTIEPAFGSIMKKHWNPATRQFDKPT